ncbi:Protein serrate,Protein eyes shut homolog,Neurogenic locus Notch protein,Neurogenic locus notch homolog protein 3,Protein eyes shut,Delta and Notch-like epidermal growth factor-related receptor,Delta-like protein C,Neurogenic locus notch homolog protein 1,Fibropellin-3,Protein crumbs homolog 2,Sushi, von Willebrand factor type A, EGF and pentraxin domain-containing protein 1,Protein jagged-2,Neurogenic locus notch homolog protein 2,Protein crumbs homolog 1,Delta-like protein D,Protein jagged-1,Protein jagg|uniref:HMCN n=1 Tax=Mytilus coruscus TaxID=42192 RepID=A0A6J8D1J7_MYTCO|nr:Protein serrate,Protein eyes shut homolog,Neurogenic locus Notch protein,Neurogenic locus notch homolog protein 3,Protein eyes shut,Delta and Notch-like epidermal growth factor-related receptor,Delta-like protein C,Neurogenic locus notch homolog protein 1,Fibropellin-3,Protein crumbs homolog 2,Sushi, von Willebrand factor type A, EGF and pentraxin domain-containing protein 1,Protein jagged-2,Neurogenic locus notch homolog protein 2,Protein crumbs homolog 1,Delta-like protein D,Protein jagged-1,P
MSSIKTVPNTLSNAFRLSATLTEIGSCDGPAVSPSSTFSSVDYALPQCICPVFDENNGHCLNDHSTNLCPYSCNSGYTGEHCLLAIDINECASSPCKHGGVCHDAVDSFTCSCTAGYVGSYCETDINECASSPCQNGGICHDAADTFTCTCTPGYVGSYCETDIDECKHHPCYNGGTCVNTAGSFNCSCRPGYNGELCLNDTNECISNPCLNGATCGNLLEKFVCFCRHGYTGILCESVTTKMVGPQINTQTTVILTEGTQIARIPCFAEGIPFPTIVWEGLNQQLPFNAKQVEDFLQFTHVTPEDEGFYVCRASNDAGVDLEVVQIIVKGMQLPSTHERHIMPTIKAPSSITARYFSTVNISCQISGYPKPNVTWKFNNKKISKDGSTILIPQVSNFSRGIYSCAAENDAGVSEAHIHLYLSGDKPKIVTPPLSAVIIAGKPYNMTCVATGLPYPTLTWTFSSFLHQNQSLPIHNINKSGSVITLTDPRESGILTCIATNEFGVDQDAANIIVRQCT